MKNYHLTQEQALEIASKLELAGLDITAWENGYVEFETKEALQIFVNTVLDQVLGEPVATKLISDPYDERDGLWFDLGDIKNLKELPVGTKLYAPKESALGSLEQQPDGSVHFEEYKP